MDTAREILEKMRAAAPAGQPGLDDDALLRLYHLTRSLIAASADADEEHARFLAIRHRRLCMPDAELEKKLRGASVLVTGGTGCIGSVLLRQLRLRNARHLVSMSRGSTDTGPRLSGVEYLHGDIRDRQSLDEVIRLSQPDVIFHVAGQRSPGLAELEVHRTVTTNVLGTLNVLAAAKEAAVPQVVCASTGKALRPYSPEIYTASKRAAEWVASRAAADGDLLCSAARFTHVVDNSIVYGQLVDWAESGGLIRLHSADIGFYAQSALESAQLLLLASLGDRRGELWIHAMTDLGWPISLLDLTIGVLKRTGSAAPIYISGYDRGYEEVPFPGLYDPATAGEVSPLLNAFEATTAGDSPCPMVDAFRLETMPDRRSVELLAALNDVCEDTQDAAAIRAALDELSWSLLDMTLRAVPGRTLVRAAAMADAYQNGLNREHKKILAAMQRNAAPGMSSPGPEPGSPHPAATAFSGRLR